ncbi:hypothetical protein Maq22A_1p36185 (plasmid) [Methylobacterium aquaticum]|uniref:Uncharacterized protein n=1 Tax=Methylobacterium aquaticum TaxID=270351 RepID=A0A0C6G0X8_9HYPH|nr:hypothetical protein Maq22A_1p36185 [Methylobacterium aquaticum]
MPMRITSFRYFPAEEDAGCKWEMDAEPVPGAPAATVTLRADWNAPALPSFDLAERGEQP